MSSGNNFSFRHRLSQYGRISLGYYYAFGIQRHLIYLLFTLLAGLFTFIAFGVYEILRPVIEIPLPIMGLYAWQTAFNFGLCLYLLDEWISRLWKGWGDFKNRTVAKVWLIWFTAFILAFAVQRTWIYQTFQLYYLDLRWYFHFYLKARPTHLESFVFCFPFWFFIAFALIQIMLKKQGALERVNAKVEEILKQKEKQWLSGERSDQEQIHADLPKPAALILPPENGSARIDPNQISYIGVEDHYCHIFVKELEDFKKYFVKSSLKEILNQLPRDHFVQIHRSHVINLSHVSHLVENKRFYQLVLDHGAYTLPISRYRLPQVLSILEKTLS